MPVLTHSEKYFMPSLKTACAAIAATAVLLGATLASAADSPDFSNPAVALSSEAVIASGTCIAKYAPLLEDRTRPAEEIGQRIARRCSKQISRSAGLASWMVGKPQEFAKNLKYTRDDLTTRTVLRYRAE
jgi:hypothetical protein